MQNFLKSFMKMVVRHNSKRKELMQKRLDDLARDNRAMKELRKPIKKEDPKPVYNDPKYKTLNENGAQARFIDIVNDMLGLRELYGRTKLTKTEFKYWMMVDKYRYRMKHNDRNYKIAKDYYSKFRNLYMTNNRRLKIEPQKSNFRFIPNPNYDNRNKRSTD